MKRAVVCPSGCGSQSFSAVRRGALIQDFTIDPETGEVVEGGSNAEGGGRLTLNCSECGRSWTTRRPLDLAQFVDGR